MSKLAEYMLVLAEDGTEQARHREDQVQAMSRFGLSRSERQAVVSGDPAAIRAAIARAQRQPEPKPKPPKPPIPLQGYSL